MKQTKRARLEAHRWRVGSAQEFLGLSAEEALVETKLRLSRAVRERRAKLSQSQAALAKRLNSSQSRVAKMEAADPNMSVDLLLNALFALLMDAAGISDVPSDRSRYPPRPIRSDSTPHGRIDWFLRAGCGHGAATLWLAAHGGQVTAVDFSIGALAWAVDGRDCWGRYRTAHRLDLRRSREPEGGAGALRCRCCLYVAVTTAFVRTCRPTRP
jgi:transcriptional regulator with XRE-family HTH domain